MSQVLGETSKDKKEEVLPVIRISEVLKLIESGMTRSEIAKHYDLKEDQCKLMFLHKKLKGKRAKKKVIRKFTLIDDLVGNK